MHRNKMIKPTAPSLQGLPKIHKTNVPIRPLINFTSAPSYRIAKWLNKWLNTHIVIENNHSIKNNLELVNKIEGVQVPPNSKLASFDVTNMYSNIPIQETIEITKNLLIKNKINSAIIREIIKLLEEITFQNYFRYKDKFYKQPDGLPMGSPLSGTLANFYLNNLENNHILNTKNKFINNIVYWHRYVDDVLVLFKGTDRQINLMLNYINNIHTKIKFTLEMEQNSMINFLDLEIKIINQNHTFKIYRKPTQTDQTIDVHSNHPWQHKLAAYNHLIHRLNSIPLSDEDYLEELNTIKYIAQQNGYKSTMVETMNAAYKRKMDYRNNTTLTFDNRNNDKKYINVEYNPNTSRYVQNILQNYGYNTSYKTNQKLEKFLKPRNVTTLDTGVYKLSCSDCASFYIGQTGRSFGTRFKEHIREIGKINCFSNFALHINNTLHNYGNMDQNLEVMYRMKKSDMLDRKEEFEIYRNRNHPNLLNTKINTSAHKIYDMILQNLQ